MAVLSPVVRQSRIFRHNWDVATEIVQDEYMHLYTPCYWSVWYCFWTWPSIADFLALNIYLYRDDQRDQEPKFTWQNDNMSIIFFSWSFWALAIKYHNSSTSIAEKRLPSRNGTDVRQRCFHLLCAACLVNLLEKLTPMGFPSAHRGSADGSLKLNLTPQTMENSRK